MTAPRRTRPPRLRPGDRIGLVAPAGPVPGQMLEQAVAIVRGWGFEPVVGEHLGHRHPSLPYLAGTDVERAADFTRVWCAPEVAAVWCLRGGYGCLRMVDHLDLATLRAAGPRALLGSSDVTLLHELLGAELGLATVFSPMPATTTFLSDPAVRERVRRALREPAPVVLSGEPIGPRRVARGHTVGGTASVLVSSIGGRGHAPPRAGAIALLEDVTESPYRLDRILTQLARAGWFAEVAGIAVGSLHECGEPEAVRAAVCSVLEPLGVPVLWGLPFGHGPDQHVVPLGTPAVLDPSAGTLRVEPALA